MPTIYQYVCGSADASEPSISLSGILHPLDGSENIFPPQSQLKLESRTVSDTKARLIHGQHVYTKHGSSLRGSPLHFGPNFFAAAHI